MIIGVGTDLLEIERIRRILNSSAGDRFLERVLTPPERELAAKRRGRLAEFLAGRFAAKEALVKALGCGIGKEVGFQDLSVLPDAKGKPTAQLAEAAWLRIGLAPDAVTLHVSITHSESMAMAYAIAEQPHN
ncbi:holo-ACP synthase [Paenibacillus silviterrae]|uniref:holo-ACP synthase n=1 Tax=Paenibacillus silviterrae TaxID=3242194 RepID=UPI002542D735|nr:holo-ACP synthase [Paenibacillus chinjuensis]